MELNNIEKHYRDSFHNHETPIDTNEIWDNIEGEIEGKKKRRFLFWWFFGAGLIILGALVITNYELLITRGNGVHSGESILPKTSITSSVEVEDYCPEEHLGNENAELQTVVDDALQEVDDANRSTRFGARKLASTNTIKPRITASAQSKEMNRGNIAEKGMEEEKSKDINTNGPNRYDFKTSAAPKTRKSVLVPSDRQAENKQQANSSKEETTSTKHPVIPKIQESSESDRKEATGKNASKKPPTAPNSATTQKKKGSGQYKNRKKSPWNSSLEIYGEVGLPLRQFSARSGNQDSLIMLRENSEKSLEEFGAGFNYKLKHKNGLLLLTGLNYQQITEKMTFTERKEEQVEINTIINYTVNALQDSIPTYGLATVNQISERDKISYNRYRMLNLPLGIGGSFGNKKLKVDVVGGLDVNLFYRPTGSFVSRSGNPVNLETYMDKKTVGFGLFGTLTFGIPLNKKWQLNISPSIKQQLGSMTPKDYPLKQKYTVLSLRVGVEYDL